MWLKMNVLGSNIVVRTIFLWRENKLFLLGGNSYERCSTGELSEGGPQQVHVVGGLQRAAVSRASLLQPARGRLEQLRRHQHQPVVAERAWHPANTIH